MQAAQPKLILASQSPRRHSLLSQLGIPFTTHPAHVEETPLKHEAPLRYTQRVASAKAKAVAAAHPGCVVLAADTPVLVGRRILQSPANIEEARAMLTQQSGRRVYVPTAVVVIDAHGKLRSTLVVTWLKLKRLSEEDLEGYLATNHWQGTSGGMRGEFIEPWFTAMQGSRSGYLGLPLYETAKLLTASGLSVNLFQPPLS
jgi:septum formation protein